MATNAPPRGRAPRRYTLQEANEMARTATMPRAPREVDEDGIAASGNGNGATDDAAEAGDARIEIGATAVKDMPTAEWALYRRVSTILNKAGITEEQLREM